MSAPGFTSDALVSDLDNDGRPGDGAFAMAADNNVTVIRLSGNTLQSPVTYPAGTNPVAVAAGDVNGDSFIDLVTANAGSFVAGNYVPGSLHLLAGNAAGTFGAPSPLTAGTSPGDVGVGDFNGDGKPDLAAAVGSDLSGADVTTRSLIVRLGTGGGAFGPEIPVATPQRTLALQVVDFNPDTDGYDDIVTTGSVLLGRGDGTFAAPVNVAPGLSPRLVEVQDLNGDQKPDIILGSATPGLATTVSGHGDGTVDAPRHYPLRSSAEKAACFDIDGDGMRDLLFTNGGDAGTPLFGAGDGAFQWVQAAPSVANPLIGSSATGAAVADFTGDGIPDVAVANGGALLNGSLFGNPAAILPGLGGGRFGSPLEIPGQPGTTVVAGDWNADGKPDLAFVAAARNSSGGGGNFSVLTIAPGLGGGAFGPYATTVLPGPGTPSALRLTLVKAFVNHDSIPDLLVGNLAVDEVSVFLGNGSGAFTAQAPVVIGTAPVTFDGTGPPGLAVADFNGDTHADLAVSYGGDFGMLNGGLKIALGSGNGTFQSPQSLRSAVAAKGVAAADFNRDGHMDLALAMEYQSFRWDVAIYAGNGDGTFAAPAPLGLTEDLVSGVVVLDADQDGKPDLGVPLGGDDVLGLRGLGDGTFARVIRVPVGGSEVLTADLNQDGWPDMLAPNGLLAFYINHLPSPGLAYPQLEAGFTAGKVVVKWPVIFGDYALTESPAPGTPFTPSGRSVSSKDGYFNVEVNPAESASKFFRLEQK